MISLQLLISENMEKLPESVLENCSLPLKLDPIELTGKIIKLRPLDIERDSHTLYERSNGSPISLPSRSIPGYDSDELIWKYLSIGPFSSFQEFRSLLIGLESDPRQTPFCVFDLETDSPIGLVCIESNFPLYLKAEIAVIFSPIAQRTGANMESIYLLLQHMFKLGYRRMAWKCNALNNRSRDAALKIGFTFEGVQEFHMIVKGCNRDTAWFRILNHEWEDVEKKLANKIYHRE